MNWFPAVQYQYKENPRLVIKVGEWSCMCVDGASQHDNEFIVASPAVVRPKLPVKGVTSKRRPEWLPEATPSVATTEKGFRPTWLPAGVASESGTIDDADSAGGWNSVRSVRSDEPLQRFWSLLSQPEVMRTPSRSHTADLSQRMPSVAVLDEECDEDEDDDAIAKPNFEGRWLMSSYEGDMDSFLKDIGTSYTLRTMAKAGDYGVGKLLQDIRMNGSEMILITENPVQAVSMTATIGGNEAESIGLDGQPNFVTLRWQAMGNGAYAIKTESRDKDNKQAPPTFRYFDAEKMVVEATMTNGAYVRRFFTYQGETSQVAR